MTNKTEENFQGKYSEANFFTQRLIDGFYRRLAELSKGLDAESVLEVGCGHGFSTAYLADIFAGKKLEASEYLPALAIDAQKRNPSVKTVQESIYDLKRSDNGFDLVLALEVLEHLENPERAMEELRRVAGRYVIISVPREPLWRLLNMIRGKYLTAGGNTPGHINHWSKRGLEKFVGRYFTVERIISSLPWTIILAGKK